MTKVILRGRCAVRAQYRDNMSTKLATWIADHKVSEIECIVPDMNGVQRGKVLPAAKFLSRRLPRTFAAARLVVAALDEDLVRVDRPVTLKAAKKALEKAQVNWDAAGDGK